MNSDTSALEQRLIEACDELWDNLVDPREPYCDGDGTRWLALNNGHLDHNAAGCVAGSEHELRHIRAQCRALAVENEFAINGHENRISYLVGSGHSYRATARKHQAVPATLPGQVQQVLDEFISINRWQQRQQEIVRRKDRDGEAFLRFFTAADGTTRVRFIEPGLVSTPPEWSTLPAASFGIVTEPDDVETVLSYFVDGGRIDAGEVQHRKANVDANVKRGLPLYYPVIKNLKRAEKLLRNMSTLAEIQSAIALIRKHRRGTRSAVQQFVADQADATLTSSTTGKTTSYKRFAPGTILDAYGNIDYDFPAAAINAGSYVVVLQAELRAIASRLVMPEFMLSSDASNANYASTLVAEGPAVKMFERLQAEQIAEDLDVMWRVVQGTVDAGRLPQEALTLVEIQASPPALTARDALRDAQVSRLEHDSGILSAQTWSQRRGLDYDQEQANIAAHGQRPTPH